MDLINCVVLIYLLHMYVACYQLSGYDKLLRFTALHFCRGVHLEAVVAKANLLVQWALAISSKEEIFVL